MYPRIELGETEVKQVPICVDMQIRGGESQIS